MGSERLWTALKRSEVSFDFLVRSEAFLNVVMGSMFILKVPERSEAFLEYSEGCCFELSWKVPDGSDFDVHEHSCGILRHSYEIWALLKGSWRF